MKSNFRERVRSGEVLLGAFLKTASHQVAEVLGHSGLDFAIVDAEHAPFDLATLDAIALAASATDLTCLVRTPDLAPAFVGQCLDLGLAGVLAPHVDSAEAALGIVRAAKYAGGQRGFSPSTRANRYGTLPAGDYLVRADRESIVWCQIEDAAALDRLDEIAAIADVDCLFIGRADLALSLGVSGPGDPKVASAVEAIADACRRHGRAVGIYLGDTAELPSLLALGVTVFACGSDQSFLLAQGRRIREDLGRALAGASR